MEAVVVVSGVAAFGWAVIAGQLLLTCLGLRPLERPDDWVRLSLLWPRWLVAALTVGVTSRAVRSMRVADGEGERLW